MKIKVVFSMLVLLLLLLEISYVCAYHTDADTYKTIFTEARLSASSSGLSNGTYNTYAKVNYGSINAGSFGSNSVSASVSDMGLLS